MAGNGYRPLIANKLSKLSAQNKIGSRSPTSLLMQEMGLEPTRYCYHRHLKPARLPIPPLLRTNIILPKSLEECKHKFKKLYENYTKCMKNYKSVTTPALIYLKPVHQPPPVLWPSWCRIVLQCHPSLFPSLQNSISRQVSSSAHPIKSQTADL